ncbi:MAG: hypothetical protein KAJ19_10785, partial [Gammaproteobacteria bacterium]|nr:hypothetical protein [Gammaproteobacteria bacterium]
MDGRGVKTLEPPYPPIEITSLVHEEESLSVDPDDLHVLGSPVGPEFLAPRIVRLHPSYSTGSRQYPRTY